MDNSNKNTQDDMEKLIDSFYQKRKDDKLKEKWKNILSTEYSIEKSPRKSNKIHWITGGIISLAATVGLLVFVFNPFASMEDIITNSNVQMAQVQVITNPSYDHRGNDNSDLNSSYIAYSLMKEQKYAEAIKIYEESRMNQKLNAYDTYHLGLAFAKNKEFAKSITVLKILKQESETYEQEINWLLALNNLILNQKEEATSILNYIIENNDYKSQEAKTLIDKLT